MRRRIERERDNWGGREGEIEERKKELSHKRGEEIYLALHIHNIYLSFSLLLNVTTLHILPPL